MPTLLPCPSCNSFNKPDATDCHTCGRRLGPEQGTMPEGTDVVLKQVMGGEVYSALVGGEGRRTRAPAPPPPSDEDTEDPISSPDPEIEDNSDVIGAALDRIRAKAHEEGHRFKPYVRSKSHKGSGPQGHEELTVQMDLAVSLLRERRFEEAIEPLLKAIARDDENRPPWILLGEAYLRVDRPYKAAVAYLRSLELSPKDEQAWLGLGRVLRFIDELPTAAAVLERATRIRPEHADTWVERGLVLASMQKLPEALRSFGKALDIRPDHRIALAKRTEVEAMLRERGAVETDREPAEIGTVPRPPNAAEAEAAFEVDILEEIGSLGLKLDVPKGSLVVLDPRTAADILGEKKDWVDALEAGIKSIKEKRGLDLIVIDSLEALEVLAKFKDRRREMYRLFEWLRDLAVTSFVVTERPDWLIAGHVLQGRWDEDFLADGVIQLRIHMVSDLEAQRRLRVVKMRGTKHETGYLAMVLDEGRFRVTRAMST